MVVADKISYIQKAILNYFSICRKIPQDGFAFMFLNIAAILTYLNATYVLLPVILEEYPKLLIFATFITTWLFIGAMSNLYLIRIRDSSIRNRMLMEPNIKVPPSSALGSEWTSSPDQVINERTKYIGQQFMAQPYGEDDPWHICANCEIFVPPRAWHCQFCKTCIFRRDHHCIFAMACIGEENHSNFLGLLFYLGCGASLATIVNFIHAIYFADVVWWMFLVKAFVPFYVILYDFSITNMLTGTNLIGQGVAWLVFIYYLMLTAKGQTSVDKSRGINRISNEATRSYENLKTMIGPNPLLRIIYPFHQKNKLTAGQVQPSEEELRKGL